MPAGDPAYQLRDDPRPTSEADGDKRGTKRWYRRAKETKRGEKDVKESQCPIVALKRGNGPTGPRGAKGVPRCGWGVGTTPRTPCLTGVSPRNDPVVRGTATSHNVTNRMHLKCTSGSVGALGSNPQGDPALWPSRYDPFAPPDRAPCPIATPWPQRACGDRLLPLFEHRKNQRALISKGPSPATASHARERCGPWET